MTGIDVEDNAIVGNVVDALYEVVPPKIGRSNGLNGLTIPLLCTPPMSNRPTLGSTLLVHKISWDVANSTRVVKKNCNKGEV